MRISLLVDFDETLVSAEFMADHILELEGVEAVDVGAVNEGPSAENGPHVRHADSHGRPWPIGSWFCCGAVQLGIIGPDDCNECGEPWPCHGAIPPEETKP